MSTDPLKAFVDESRAQLAGAGMRRGEVGESVVWRGGRGDEALVLLHGVNDQAGTWAPVVPLLADRYRLIIPDLAGHGESGPRDGALPMPLIVERLAEVIGSERVTLVGNSMGGWVAMLFGIAHPAQVERLVLENASGMMWNITAPLVPQSREQAREAMRCVNGPNDATPDDYLDALVARVHTPMMRVIQSGVLQHLVDPHLGRLTMPVSLIWGEHDGLLPLAYARALRERIPGATLQIIEGAAHIPHRQKPEQFVACLMEIFSPSAPA